MGEEEVEVVGSGTKKTKGKGSKKGKERAMEETEGGEDEVEVVEKAGKGVGTGTKGNKGKKGKEGGKEKTGKGGEKGEEEGSEGTEGEGGEGEGERKVVVASTTIDAMDTVCNDAIFGFCRLNLFDPPAPLVFGTFNKRPLVESQAKKFAANMGPVRPFARSNMLPLVIAKEDVDEGCYKLSPNVEKAPFLKLKAGVAERIGYGLKLAGGRHRHRAMQLKRDDSKEVMTKIRDRLTEARDALKEGKGGAKNQKTLQKNIEEMEQQLEEEREVEKILSVWGVVLYEEGKWDQ